MDLSKYGIHIERTIEQPCYRLTSITKMPGDINRGAHNVFVRVWNKQGYRYTPPDVRIKAMGVSTEYARLDKPASPMERGHGDVPMYASTTYTISIVDDAKTASDVVIGLHTRHPDEEAGNTWGHHSFVLEFHRHTGVVQPPQPSPRDKLFDKLYGLMQQQVDVVAELEKLL